jgi:hypothetical protein
MITPDALRVALDAHHDAADAYRALGITRQAVHARDDLRAVLRAWREQRQPSARNRRYPALPDDTARALRAMARRRGGRPDLSGVARALVLDALRGALPEPEPPGGHEVQLDLGGAWDALLVAAGDHDRAIGVLRAILGKARNVRRRP